MPPELLDYQREFSCALGQPATGAMAVYRNTVLHGAVEALRANFPVVETIVGTEMFEAVAVDFATDCPPRQPVLALYGDEFADWLAQQAWIDDLRYLPDVARVERLGIESLMAADAEPLRASHRALHELHDCPLVLHPALRFTWLSTPAMSIWLAHQRPIAAELELDWKAEGALFARPEPHVVHSLRIGAAAHRLLAGIRIGETLGTAMAAIAWLYPDTDRDALFSSLVNLGAFLPPEHERT